MGRLRRTKAPPSWRCHITLYKGVCRVHWWQIKAFGHTEHVFNESSGSEVWGFAPAQLLMGGTRLSVSRITYNTFHLCRAGKRQTIKCHRGMPLIQCLNVPLARPYLRLVAVYMPYTSCQRHPEPGRHRLPYTTCDSCSALANDGLLISHVHNTAKPSGRNLEHWGTVRKSLSTGWCLKCLNRPAA
jgi:hypothetical protein